MPINELLKVVTPPSKPVKAQNGNAWKSAQKAIGIKLPTDFREYGIHYGSGTLADGNIAVMNPLSVEEFESSVNYVLETARDVKSDGLRHFPYNVHPDRPGLFPWGGDENGNVFYWLTEAEPDYWPVVVESHEGDFERFDMSMTTFLAKALTNEIRPKHIWYRPFTDEERKFAPEA